MNEFVERENLEASIGIEPMWTNLQSAASPLRQLAACSEECISQFSLGVQGH